MQGAADSKGPFVWLTPPGDEVSNDANDLKDRLPIRDVLAWFKLQPPEKLKLLILDCTQVPSAWGYGLLHNNFVQALKEQEKEIADVPNLVVLCSSDENQRSWVSEEWQMSIFAHFVEQALAGATGESRLTATKLHEW